MREFDEETRDKAIWAPLFGCRCLKVPIEDLKDVDVLQAYEEKGESMCFGLWYLVK
ncbi:hypothetical protein RDI58_013674 [Solanum bulbocastanum]|uniref:Uncharacterized protein n=1 Tax=Solanum bulbocastanum TaxID=147425 RepID=A0AAN8TN98_SOLBU